MCLIFLNSFFSYVNISFKGFKVKLDIRIIVNNNQIHIMTLAAIILFMFQLIGLDTVQVLLPDSMVLSFRLGFERVETVNYPPFLIDPNTVIPGATFSADGGSPFGGYSYLRLRGGDATRISWTLGNFSLSELEDFEFYMTERKTHPSLKRWVGSSPQ